MTDSQATAKNLELRTNYSDELKKLILRLQGKSKTEQTEIIHEEIRIYTDETWRFLSDEDMNTPKGTTARDVHEAREGNPEYRWFIERLRSMLRGSDIVVNRHVSARDWLADHCPVFESHLSALINAGYVSETEPKIKWLKSQALLAGLLRATVEPKGYFDEIRDVDDFIDYQGKTLASQFRQKGKPRGWESLKTVIPSLTLDDSEPLQN